MKRFVTAMALTCVLSLSALGGDIPTTGYAPPAPDETQTPSATAPGDVPTGDYTREGSTDITLTVVQAILSLLSV